MTLIVGMIRAISNVRLHIQQSLDVLDLGDPENSVQQLLRPYN